MELSALCPTKVSGNLEIFLQFFFAAQRGDPGSNCRHHPNKQPLLGFGERCSELRSGPQERDANRSSHDSYRLVLDLPLHA